MAVIDPPKLLHGEITMSSCLYWNVNIETRIVKWDTMYGMKNNQYTIYLIDAYGKLRK